ncbi:hypothetical protein H0H92_003568 [Tricholoma furcatifolium]|nr:hypothetical protein H0H92_003568 [Tricholoma furcatifolium]
MDPDNDEFAMFYDDFTAEELQQIDELDPPRPNNQPSSFPGVSAGRSPAQEGFQIIKRGRGRPRGSRNKKQDTNSAKTHRPRRTQLAKAAEDKAKKKQGPGRPRKTMPKSRSFLGMFVPGTPNTGPSYRSSSFTSVLQPSGPIPTHSTQISAQSDTVTGADVNAALQSPSKFAPANDHAVEVEPVPFLEDDTDIRDPDAFLQEGIGSDDGDEDEPSASSKIPLRPLPNWLKSAFDAHHGMGARQFSNALLVQHLQKYDLLHLSYLHTLATDAGSLFATRPFARKFKLFLPFDDKSSDGLQGFVPSAQWLRDVYDSFVNEHRNELNQHMSMLSGDICAIDHSFKLAKQVAKIDGVQIFNALLTVTNEKGEIRVCSLVASKAHSQFEPALEQMRNSLVRYGHTEPKLFYTDNMSDKECLEKCFPSLRKDVIPIEKHAHLDQLTIPEEFTVSVKQSATTINDAMRTILEALPDDDSDEPLVIGLDTEWNLEVSQHGYVTGRGQTAILQIAHGSNIFILQIGPMLAGNQLPLQLKQVLTNPRIIKVGRCVSGDLKYLEKACQSDIPFIGGLDIARLAKDHFYVTTARISLEDLCAAILKRRLSKNSTPRVSTAWENSDLTPEQIHYAALDVYASLSIYNTLIASPIPKAIVQHSEVGAPILLFSNDNTRIIAKGAISSHQNDTTYMGINITPSRSVIEVHKVLVPGALVANGVSPQRSLESHGEAPFHIVCYLRHLRHSPSTESSASNETVAPASSSIIPMDSTASADREFDDSNANGGVEPSPGFGDILADVCHTNEHAESENTAAYVPDLESQLEGQRVLSTIDFSANWNQSIRSRILKDPFHVFNMLYLSASHGLLKEFAIALRDAIFIWDKADKSRIVVWGQTQNPPLSWNDILITRPDWLLRRCKRIIPPAEHLFPVIKKVFNTLGPLKDAKSGLPLFNSAAWAVTKNILLLISRGHLSDPPNIPLFYQVGIDKKTGLPLYRCMRGTNMTEGGVHTHLRSRLPSSGVSVGTFNSTGKHYIGHYSIWLTNELQEMLALAQPMLADPPKMIGWVNGNLYQPTSEVAGVLPIPPDIRAQSAMGRYIGALHSKQRHSFLASMQGTRKPVLPIHNSHERKLFHKLMTDESEFNNPVSGPNWDVAIQIWNNTADADEEISYKLTEHLKLYYNGDWKRNANIKQTKAMTVDMRRPLRNTLYDPRRASNAPAVPEASRSLHRISKGLLAKEDVLFQRNTSPNLSTFTQHPPSASYSDSTPLMPVSATTASSDEHDIRAASLARKRASASLPEPPSKRPKKKPRTCRKCGLESCDGRKELSMFADMPGFNIPIKLLIHAFCPLNKY